MWQLTKSETLTECSLENFHKAVKLLIKKPQTCSPIYRGAIVNCWKFGTLTKEQIDCLVKKLRTSVCDNLTRNEVTEWTAITADFQWFENLLSYDGIQCSPVEEDFVGGETTIYIQHLIPKNTKYPKKLNVIIVDSEMMLTIPVLKQSDDSFLAADDPIYKVQYSNNDQPRPIKIDLHVYSYPDFTEKQLTPVKSIYRKFIEYCQKKLESVSNQSLRLVDLELYNDLYNELKRKYSEKLIQDWKEGTDAKKFVFEDIAIATYLILVFEEERKRLKLDEKQSFLDIGCGNGLLVYLLTKEGYRGTGYDVRKRRIWDYFEGVDLQEKTIDPRDSKFPDYDWLIGNHSDEMTPWIPVMSRKSGADKNFFVLPCCPHDFNGKFRDRKFSSHSQVNSVYQDYLNYVEEIVDKCGFIPERDMLKIPSTKRTCFIGRRRKEVESDIDVFVLERCKRLKTENDPQNSSGNVDFVPREKEERIRNCTQLDKQTKDSVVKTVFERILSQRDAVEIDGRLWNRGATGIPLKELIPLFAREVLDKLMNESGGLQTLLKNHRHIFKVVKGQVSFRYGETRDGSTENRYFKTCLCYFHEHHPDGCWQSRDLCPYAHGQDDLRSLPVPS